jgi:hypothetical protein
MGLPCPTGGSATGLSATGAWAVPLPVMVVNVVQSVMFRSPLGLVQTLASCCCCKAGAGVRLNEHLAHPDGEVVFRHACKMGLEGIVSKRLGSRYRSGRSPDWLKMKNPDAPAVKREAEEDWGR